MVTDFLDKLPRSGLNSLNQSKNSCSLNQSKNSCSSLKNPMGKAFYSNTYYKEFNKSNSILSTISNAGSISPSKQRSTVPSKEVCNMLENFYSKLGHEIYSKLMNIFERYCLYGKTHTNFNLDFQQFSHFTSQNGIYNESISRTQGEFIFNKVRKENKCKKITFK
jgi:hypothetical protein